MTFTFPKDKALFRGVLHNFTKVKNWFDYALIDINKPKDNMVSIDNIDYYFTYFNNTTGKNKGGNSIILKLFTSQKIDVNEIEYGNPDLVLKILKYKKSKNPLFKQNIEKRFELEVKSLTACNYKDFQNVIKISNSGVCNIYNPEIGKYEEYLFYTMEYAEYDLKTYIEANHLSINIEEKVSLCISLSEGLKELESLGFYHRDIKPDNIFIIDGIWKIGDLGLIDDRNTSIDYDGEPIGPRGWMSPESMNKYLCEGKAYSYIHPTKINHQSDIFQLGKVFWYIFQYNAPIGSIKGSDFKVKNSSIYAIIRTMLNYSQARRYKRIEEVIKLLRPIEIEVLKTTVIS